MVVDLEPVFRAIDAANADDPNLIDDQPLALVQGRLALGWVLALDPAAGPALQLAARAHHLRRWVVPRDTYPSGRAGYLRWRRDQKKRHGTELADLLSADVPEPVRDRAVEIVQKIGLGHDDEVQTFEDAVSLTFIQTQFLSTADKLADDDKMVEVVAKTLRKMSARGITAAGSIEMDERGADIVDRAVRRLTA
jgi:hypothetical protein